MSNGATCGECGECGECGSTGVNGVTRALMSSSVWGESTSTSNSFGGSSRVRVRFRLLFRRNKIRKQMSARAAHPPIWH